MSGSSTRPVSALVVDDHRAAAEALAVLLELYGCAVRVAWDGPAALAAVADERPDVVFLDIGMPLMDGWEVARRIRAAVLEPQPVIVAVTGYGSDDDRRQSAAAGFDRHLVKPADASDLAAVVDHVRGLRDGGAGRTAV